MSDSYAQEMLGRIAISMPGEDPHLIRLYTLLALTKGTSTTLQDVHDAWSLWRLATQPRHPAIIPFAQLSPQIQELDQPYMEIIHRAATQMETADG